VLEYNNQTVQHKYKENKKMTQINEFQPVFELTVDRYENGARENFDQALLAAVDSGLMTLGNSGKRVFYECLQMKYGIAKEDIPNKFDLFVTTLENVFGKAVCLIEMQIMETLHQYCPDFEFKSDIGVFSFRQFVETFRGYL
jgi:hypothetical protein